MIDLIKSISDWALDKSISITKKTAWIIITLLISLCINEYTGFLYYYPLSKEVEIINNIESAKEKAQGDSALIVYLNKQEQKVMNRFYIHDWVIASFKDLKLPEFKTNGLEKAIEKQPDQEKSKFWHVITSSFLFILMAILFFFMILTIPTIEKGKRLSTFMGIIVSILILGAFTWIFQYLWGLLPVLGYIGVNYSIQISFQVIIFILIIKYSNKRI